MYSLTNLPCFPTESRSVEEDVRHSFVEDDAITAVVRRQTLGWQELRYIGEDFAGRDDYPAPLTNTPQAWPARQACGAFFTPAAAAAAPAGITASSATGAQDEGHAPLWRSSLAIASAAAILLSASLIGLWAAHSFAPHSTQEDPQRNQQNARMITQLGAH